MCEGARHLCYYSMICSLESWLKVPKRKPKRKKRKNGRGQETKIETKAERKEIKESKKLCH